MRDSQARISVSDNSLSLSLSLLSSLPAAADTYGTEDGFSFTMLPNGRVTDLTIGTAPINFCSVGGTLLTGGFYIRDNTPVTIGGLPIDPLVNPNLLDPGFSRFNGEPDDVLGAPYSDAFWWYSHSGDILNQPSVTPIGDNNVALISVDENPQPDDPPGHYGAVYTHVDLRSSATSKETEMYYLAFEVKTNSGWRSYDDPYAFDDGGVFDETKYGPHTVLARIEWFSSDPRDEPFYRTLPANILYDTFTAYETTSTHDASSERLTRFCGRTIRPFLESGHQAPWARVTLIVEGYMPDDGPSAENAVYFDNIAFFEAPPIQQVYGDGTIPGSRVKLYHDAVQPGNYLNLKMDLTIQTIQPDAGSDESYLLFSGTLFNDDDIPLSAIDYPRSIDLGFAFPILDDTNEGGMPVQKLEWHYDVNHAAFVDDLNVGPRQKVFPYTMSSHVDARPAYDLSVSPVGVVHQRSLGSPMSSYPLGALAIHRRVGQWTIKGLSFGDSLDVPERGAPLTINVSHAGYRIDQLPLDLPEPAGEFIGYAYIEFHLGLLAENSPISNGTDFSFILFRSDNEEYVEKSVFREGLHKYQRSFYPDFFTRPTFTREGEGDWLFGGAQFHAQTPPDPEQNGLDHEPNEFGIRYEQIKYFTNNFNNIRDLLAHLRGMNVSAVAYDFPWAATFINDPGDSMNTISVISSEAQGQMYEPPHQSIYDEKANHLLSLPPLAQNLFYRDIEKEEGAAKRYLFPVLAAMTPDVSAPTTLISAELEYFDEWYRVYTAYPHLIAGVEFDNTYRDCHLELNSTVVDEFADDGGRLTYSFNAFAPAVPQVATNTWFFPHVREKLKEVDGGWSTFTNHGDGSDAASDNIEQEIISINANEKDLGGSKYAIMQADVIGFESSVQLDFNNSEESFDFRRSMARNKPVSRALGPVDCVSIAADNIHYGTGESHLYSGRSEVFEQILDETTWASLAYGFMPAIHSMFWWENGCFPTDNDMDLFFESVRDSFWRTPPYNITDPYRRGYTNIFQMLHQGGWHPVTDVLNIAQADSVAGGDPQDLVIHRFGPSESMLPQHRPVYITLLNNDDFTPTLTKVAEYDCPDCIPIGSLETEGEVERLGICEYNFGRRGAFDEKQKDILDPMFSYADDRNFFLEIMDLDKLTLEGVGNIMGHQMIGHVKSGFKPVNDPTIEAEIFGSTGEHYSILRIQEGSSPPKLRLGGGRSAVEFQKQRVIEDKALMVFKIWLEPIGDNRGLGGDGERSAASPYYRTFGGGWTAIDDADAENGAADAVSTTIPGACALYRIDTTVNGPHRLRVKHPAYPEATAAARYDVYVLDDLEDSFEILRLSDLPEPSLSVVHDQRSQWYGDVDDDGFAAVGEFEVSGLAAFNLASVVIKVSVQADETGFVAPALLVADAVKLEAVE